MTNYSKNWYFCLEPGTLEIVDRFEGTEEDIEQRSSRLEFVKLPSGADPRTVDLSRDESGSVVVKVNREKITAINEEVKNFNMMQLRRKRNIALRNSDWTVSNDSPLSQEKIEEWKIYRTALRDFPANVSNPLDPEWPKEPN